MIVVSRGYSPREGVNASIACVVSERRSVAGQHNRCISLDEGKGREEREEQWAATDAPSQHWTGFRVKKWEIDTYPPVWLTPRWRTTTRACIANREIALWLQPAKTLLRQGADFSGSEWKEERGRCFEALKHPGPD